MLFFITLISSSKVEINTSMTDSVDNITDYTDINMLLAVQLLLPKVDSKDFVDRPTNKPLYKVKEAFSKIEEKLGITSMKNLNSYSVVRLLNLNLDKVVGENIYDEEKVTYDVLSLRKKHLSKIDILKKFLAENFLKVGSDITDHVPEDWKENPEFLKTLKNKDVLQTAKALVFKWKELSRKSVSFKNGERSTLLELPHPFIIPGGRFREYYYWDTYWILEGLIICEMDKSAENILKNFIHVIKKYGYIPNGLRKYYLFRSHPPFFPSMLLKLYNIKGGKYNSLILGEGLDMAIKEYEFFNKYRTITVSDEDNNMYDLNYYHVKTDFPRPESFGEDVLTYKNQKYMSGEEVYSNLKSGAESGWDFSSRWLTKVTDLRTINAYNQIPVDLNALMYRNERIIEKLLADKGDMTRSKEFGDKAMKRYEAINTVLWNEEEKSWMDYDFVRNKYVNHRFYFSNVFPLIYGINPPNDVSPYEVLKKYHMELFGYPGGIPASGDGPETHQQWDFPNAWAPHQHLFVDYLLSIGERKMALHVAKSFMRSVIEGYKHDKDFYEKYNVKTPGFTGAGGEYAPQTGFGWTNGTALSFINEFGDELIGGKEHTESYKHILKKLIGRGKITDSEVKMVDFSVDFEKTPIPVDELPIGGK